MNATGTYFPPAWGGKEQGILALGIQIEKNCYRACYI